MCVVSMIMDHAQKTWPESYPWTQPYLPPLRPSTAPLYPQGTTPASVSQEEFQRLKQEVEIIKELLKKAKEYDKKNNEPDCEIADKVAFVKQIADLVGVSLEDVLKKDG